MAATTAKERNNTLNSACQVHVLQAGLDGHSGQVVAHLAILAFNKAMHHGPWNQWENWSSCSSSCGTGLKQRARQCVNSNHESSNNCFGTPVQKDVCTHNCSVDHGKEQSAFLANYVQNGNSTGTLLFANVMLNKGNDYNNNAGAFTCRIPGLYFFSVTLTKKADVDIYYITCYLQVNGQNKLHIYADPNGALTEKGSYSGTTSGTFHLNQNDTVQMDL
ncbi:HMCN1-like protein [Mya arenaria]|uniref:HMCN1-like protein n=1 Tax=Mya arenaria TaxID=6604 RepID=A0ABY7EGX3_MYAAR|nr:HMCN1-like protein [Mya arenaria]